MPAWLSWIGAGLAWLIRTFLNRPPAAVGEAEKARAAAQAAADAQAQVRTEAAVVQAAVQAPDTADEVAARKAMAAAVRALPPDTPLRGLVVDYARLRDAARAACGGAAGEERPALGRDRP